MVFSLVFHHDSPMNNSRVWGLKRYKKCFDSEARKVQTNNQNEEKDLIKNCKSSLNLLGLVNLTKSEKSTNNLDL